MATSSTPIEPLRVLVVDDHRDSADSMKLMLQCWGFNVRTEYNAKKAMETIPEFRPHCILSDIGMPGIDGYTLAKTIRKEPAFSEIPLVAISAFTEPDKVREAGFDHFIIKPADPTVLETLLKKILKIEELIVDTKKMVEKQSEVVEEVKEEVKELKEELKEIKKELREVKEERE